MDTPEEIFHLVEVKRRIAEVESGRVELVPAMKCWCERDYC
jgi:hypothetical protein